MATEFHKESETLTHMAVTVQPKRQEPQESAKPLLGYKPAEVHCPKCNRDVTTLLTYRITDFTHLSVLLCSLATWPCLACFLSGIPYCITACHKVEHHCPHCQTLIGKHAKFRLSKLFGKKKPEAAAVTSS